MAEDNPPTQAGKDAEEHPEAPPADTADTGAPTGSAPSPEPETSHGTEGEQVEAAAPEAAEVSAPRARPRRGLAAALVLSVLVSALAAALAGWAWYTSERRDTRYEARLAGLEATIRQGTRELGGRLEDLRQQLEAERRRRAALEQRQETLEQGLASVRDLLGRERSDWVLAEVEYLLRVADQRMRLARDPATAARALETADQRLRELGDPAYTPLRARIRTALTRIDAVELPDVTGLYLRIRALEDLGRDLRPPTATRPAAEPGPAPGSEPDGSAGERGDWRDWLSGLRDTLKTLVVVRRHDRPVQPLLTEARISLLQEVLQLRLESAALALLKGDEGLWRASLASAGNWAQEQFDPADPAVASFLRQVSGLEQVDIQPALPDLGELVRALDRSEASRPAAGGAAGPGA